MLSGIVSLLPPKFATGQHCPAEFLLYVIQSAQRCEMKFYAQEQRARALTTRSKGRQQIDKSWEAHYSLDESKQHASTVSPCDTTLISAHNGNNCMFLHIS
jgi:hypothetical protein